jgi:hypothetical protein
MRDDLVGEGRLFEPDVMLPAQYFAILRKTAPQGPEYHLVLAMLQDAVECVQKYRFAIDPNGRELYQDAYDWIVSDDRRWPFSFENVCGILKIDPDYLRQGLFRWCDRQEELRRSAKVLPFTGRKPAIDEPLPATATARAS